MNGYIRSCCGDISIGVIPNTTFLFIARLPVIVNMQFTIIHINFLISLETLTDACNIAQSVSMTVNSVWYFSQTYKNPCYLKIKGAL